MPVISTFGRLKQEDNEFKGSLGYIVSSIQAELSYLAKPCLTKTKGGRKGGKRKEALW
jgi:hypothetical protein